MMLLKDKQAQKQLSISGLNIKYLYCKILEVPVYQYLILGTGHQYRYQYNLCKKSQYQYLEDKTVFSSIYVLKY